jgi:predicted aconitase
MLSGGNGEAARIGMEIVVAMAVAQGAAELIEVTQAHIDGCIYASSANLIFAERMAALGDRTRVPTTTNAISVDYDNWCGQGVASAFGEEAKRLADAYLRMGCRPSFTCAPYLLASAPRNGECVAWAESNAVLFANSALGARTAKHADFLDLCIALTGRAPLAGVYLDPERRARRILDVEQPDGADDSFWPLLGYVAGRVAPDRIPLLRGPQRAAPSRDDLKAMCAAFGVTSAAPMLQIEGRPKLPRHQTRTARPSAVLISLTFGPRSTTAPKRWTLLPSAAPTPRFRNVGRWPTPLAVGVGATTWRRSSRPGAT